MKKNLLVLAAASILALTSLAGCGNNASEQEPTTETATESASSGSGYMLNISDVSELLEKAEQLKDYIKNGVDSGKIPQERLDEYNNLTARLSEIISSGTAPADEVNEIRETLAAMASQASAPNDLIDYFVTDIEAENNTEKTESEKKAEEANAKLPTDVKKLIDDFNNLQNEASRNVEKGSLSMEKYTDLLEKGIEIAQIKEEFEKGGATDELVKRADEIKPYIYDIANDMNSDLKDNFK